MGVTNSSGGGSAPGRALRPWSVTGHRAFASFTTGTRRFGKIEQLQAKKNPEAVVYWEAVIASTSPAQCWATTAAGNCLGCGAVVPRLMSRKAQKGFVAKSGKKSAMDPRTLTAVLLASALAMGGFLWYAQTMAPKPVPAPAVTVPEK